MLRKRRAGVESHAEIGRMRRHLMFRRHGVGWRFLSLVFDCTDLAAAIPREAEILPLLGNAVQLAGRDVVSHAVDLVVGEP